MRNLQACVNKSVADCGRLWQIAENICHTLNIYKTRYYTSLWQITEKSANI